MDREGDAEIKHTLDRLRVLVNDPITLLGIIDDLERLLLAKGDDYSGQKDAFANFKIVAKLSAQPVYKVFMTLISVKLGRLFNIWQSGYAQPNYESSWDTVRDLLGYIVLWLAYTRKEEQDAVHPDFTD